MARSFFDVEGEAMIGRLRGSIAEIGDDHLLLDVNGVGYLVFAASRILSQLKGLSGDVTLLIETHVREDHIHLYGFLTHEERLWFRLLTGVQGVGAKMAMALLGAFSPAEMASAIAAQDKAMLTRASGVGPRLAERLITELKTKVPSLYAAMPVPAALPAAAPGKGKKGKATPQPDDGALMRQEAVSALVNLGYPRVEAFSAVARAAGGKDLSLDALIRDGLRLLSAG